MEGYNRAQSQILQNKLMQQKLDILKSQTKQNDNGLSLTQYDKFETRSSEYNAYLNECTAKINSTQDGKIVRAEIIYLDSTDKKIDLSTNNNKLTEAQKEVLKRYTQDVFMCRDKTNEMLARLPPQFVRLILASHEDMDLIFIDLLTNRITISDANIAKSKLINKLYSDWGQASTKLQQWVTLSVELYSRPTFNYNYHSILKAHNH